MYRKKLIFWSACTGMLLFGISLITLGTIIPGLRAKLAIDEVGSGTLFSILPLGILAGSLIFGPVADRFGYRILLSASTFALFVGFEGIAFAGNINLVRIFVFIIGAGGGSVNGATNALVADISEKNRGADLSLLGAFFGIGALGMPVALGILREYVSFEALVASVGLLALGTAIIYIFIRYPLPKQSHGIPFSSVKVMLKDNLLIFIAFFLFFQSSFEGIINNWTTTYLAGHLGTGEKRALFGLSAYVAGMACMRIVIGSFFRQVENRKLLIFSYWLILAGLLLIITGLNYPLILAGLFITGAGLAPGFPVMLGYTGARYADLSGTAFSLVLSFALVGNMSVNYLMGYTARNAGISSLTTFALAELFMLALLAIIIFRKLKNSNS